MKVKLLRDAKINHKAGEIVDVSPAEYQFLTSLGSAIGVMSAARVPVKEEISKEVKKTAKKKG